MSQREVAITGGPSNTKAMVTGQEELLVKVNAISPIALSAAGTARTAGLIRPTGDGNVNTVAATFYSVSVANVGAVDGNVLGANIKPGEVLNFSADALNNYFTSFAYDAIGTEFVIIFVY